MGKHSRDKAELVAARIGGHIVVKDQYNKSVCFYEVASVIESQKYGKFIVTQHHRYQDFDTLQKAIVKAVKGDKDLKVIPAPPPKTFSLFSNSLSKDFIKKRAAQLNVYVKALATLRRFKNLDCVLHFFGYYPRTKSRESSVSFPKEFGMKITDPGKKYDCHAVVKQFKETKHHKKSPAEKSGRIAINDLITRVNGRTTLDLQYGQIFELIKSFEKPIILNFLGFPIPASEEQIQEFIDNEKVKSNSGEEDDKKEESESESEDEGEVGNVRKESESEDEEEKEVEGSEDSGSDSDSDSDRDRDRKRPKRHARRAYDTDSDSD